VLPLLCGILGVVAKRLSPSPVVGLVDLLHLFLGTPPWGAFSAPSSSPGRSWCACLPSSREQTGLG
jgi:hypothetical protein